MWFISFALKNAKKKKKVKINIETKQQLQSIEPSNHRFSHQLSINLPT
jgi:hypothetical protein